MHSAKHFEPRFDEAGEFREWRIHLPNSPEYNDWPDVCCTTIKAAKELAAKARETHHKHGADTNPKSAFGMKKPPLHLIPDPALIETAMVFGIGAKKYGPFNWRESAVAASVYIAAGRRHMAAWFDGEDNDEESGQSHLAHAAACMFIILDAAAVGKLVDDRPPAGAAARRIKELTSK